MAPIRPLPWEAIWALAAVKASTVRPLERPVMVPATAIRIRGISLITVAETCSLPASRGA